MAFSFNIISQLRLGFMVMVFFPWLSFCRDFVWESKDRLIRHIRPWLPDDAKGQFPIPFRIKSRQVETPTNKSWCNIWNNNSLFANEWFFLSVSKVFPVFLELAFNLYLRRYEKFVTTAVLAFRIKFVIWCNVNDYSIYYLSQGLQFLKMKNYQSIAAYWNLT